MVPAVPLTVLTRDAFAEALRGLGAHYWDRHPFHLRLHAGRCTPDEIRSWVANRWYYQRCLAQKNAAVVANCPLPEVRRAWLPRVTFHDGTNEGTGGLADWLALAEAVGLSRDEVVDERHVLRGVRFAVDGYLHFCLTRPWTESVAAALTELFSPDLMTDRLRAWERHYDWIKPDGLAYFETRIPVARSDSADTLDLVLTHCTTAQQQRSALAALRFKCDVLGAMLDAVDYAAAAA
ncbi:pyrroloquinoline-quinone synthase PqqC [Dactylosporangium sp. NPDC005572]|uniref:pyrroloquinoline-quinone synthase PqqC n=1 Tax=Dactylosporangium sp. NPDC005572 TaxID=3156889 RepID=UPI0033B58785